MGQCRSGNHEASNRLHCAGGSDLAPVLMPTLAPMAKSSTSGSMVALRRATKIGAQHADPATQNRFAQCAVPNRLQFHAVLFLSFYPLAHLQNRQGDFDLAPQVSEVARDRQTDDIAVLPNARIVSASFNAWGVIMGLVTDVIFLLSVTRI